MTKLNIIDHGYEDIVRNGNPDDKWDGDDTYNHHDIRGLQIVADETQYMSYDIEVPFDVKVGDRLYLVAVYYNTGDSCHHEENKVDFIEIFKTAEKADALVKIVRNDKGTDRYDYSLEYENELGVKMTTHKAWMGYFESFNDVEIHYLEVRR